MKTGLIFLVALLFFPFPILATDPPPLIVQYMDHTGLLTVFADIPEGIRASVEENSPGENSHGGGSQELRSEFNRFVLKTHNMDWIENELIHYIENNSSPDFLEKSINWFNNPLVMKIHDAESSFLSSYLERERAKKAYFQKLTESTLPQERIDIINKVAEVSHVVDQVADMQTLFLTKMLESMKIFVPVDGVNELEWTLSQIPELRRSMRDKLKPALVLDLFYTYRNIENSELEEYLTYYEQPIGQSEIGLTHSSAMHVMSLWLDKAGVAFIDSRLERESSFN